MKASQNSRVIQNSEEVQNLGEMQNSGNSRRVKSEKVKLGAVSEVSAHSTVFDALFLLVLISLSSVILMPSLQANEQYLAAGHVTSSELDAYLLESLLFCKVENFEYEISPLSVLGVPVPEDSIVADSAHTLFKKEQKHRTIADLTAEYLAISLMLSENDSPVYLNPLADNYSGQASEAVATYLDRKVAGRFSYRFEAYWHPVGAFPMKSELIIGGEPPADAIRQSSKLSMPVYAGTPSKGALLACVNDSLIEASLNASDEEASAILFQAFNSSLDAAALEGAEMTVKLLFPSDYSSSGLGKSTDESFETLLYGVSENKDKEDSLSTEEIFHAYLSDLLETSFVLNSESLAGTESSSDSPSLKALLKGDIKEKTRAELEAEFSDQVNETVYAMIETKNLSEAQALRDVQIEAIYRQINPGGAKIVLYLWNPY